MDTTSPTPCTLIALNVNLITYVDSTCGRDVLSDHGITLYTEDWIAEKEELVILSICIGLAEASEGCRVMLLSHLPHATILSLHTCG